MDKRLYEFQQEGVEDILRAQGKGNRWILNFETGLGKSATALTALKKMGHQRILIICPAIVRMSWQREVTKWWMSRSVDVGVISYGKSRKLSKVQTLKRQENYSKDIQVVSYNLLPEVSHGSWEAIIIDEMHKIAHPTSTQSQAVRDVIQANPKATVLGLTATLMPNHVGDVWNPLDTLWPGRFGTQKNKSKKCFKFLKRYTNMTHNGYGYASTGVNELHARELESRLKHVSSRATKKEMAKFLPPFLVAPLYFDPKEMASKLAPEVAGAVEWYNDGEETPTVIFTHRKAAASAIGEILGAQRAKEGKPPHFFITGDIPADMRLSLIDKWREVGGPLVATMHSCGIGINGLEAAERVLFAELYYRPETVLQALGRFSRLSSEVAASVTLLIPEGTPAEMVAAVVMNKIEAINSTIRAGDSEDKLLQAMEITDDDEDLMATLTALCELAEGKVGTYD